MPSAHEKGGTDGPSRSASAAAGGAVPPRLPDVQLPLAGAVQHRGRRPRHSRALCVPVRRLDRTDPAPDPHRRTAGRLTARRAMLLGGQVLLSSFAYLGILFAIAYWGDQRADAGRSIIDNPMIYALSMAVYATSWTFYGSVGRAAATGVGFLPIYLGPTLVAALWWLVLRKMIRISKRHRITSIADFIAARYDKSSLLGGLVTVIAVVGIIPYIALQLKAVSNSFTLLLQYPE